MNQFLTRYGFLSIGIGVIFKRLGVLAAALFIPGMSSVPKQCDLFSSFNVRPCFLMKSVISWNQLGYGTSEET